MVESAGLEIRCTVLRTVGSNPTLSAKSSTYECQYLDAQALEPKIFDSVQYHMYPGQQTVGGVYGVQLHCFATTIDYKSARYLSQLGGLYFLRELDENNNSWPARVLVTVEG